jgi:flagellar basal-body rod protein FlgB
VEKDLEIYDKERMGLTMINSSAFDYINVLDKAADASWIRNDAIANNIANVDTPGYKRQDVNFEDQLQKALKDSRYTSIDAKVSNINLSRLNPTTYTDYGSYSYRSDGNNVDIDTENVELASNQIRYQGLTTSISQEFANLQAVMK